MLQILSTSNETATGAELIQNGNFSEIGSDVVDNGGFDELGTDVITNGNFANTTAGNIVQNPNFTDTAADVVINGTFATDTDWNKNPNWTISGGEAISDGTIVADTSINQSGILSVGVSYKISFEITEYNSGDGYQVRAGSDTAYSTPKVTALGVHTYYQVATTNQIYIKSGNTNGKIDNVIAEPLGEDWNINSNWSIGNEVAEADGTSDGDINQSVWLPVIDKSYKVTYEVVSRSQGEVLFKLGGVIGQAHTTIGIKTEYIVATSTERLKIDSQSSFIGSVTNISVELLGENWTQGIGWSIGDSKAISTQALGGELITNGNFDATGGELITNGSFDVTGSELVVNGDFLSAVSWNVNANWNINTASGVAEADGTSDLDLNQSIWLPVIGKSYKVTFEVVSRSQGEVLFQLGGVDGQAHTTLGIKTEYIVATSTDRLKIDSQSSFIGSVTDVSVKELGEDWNINSNWSIGNEVAEADGTSDLDINQNVWLPVIGNSYKVTFEVVSRSQGEVLFKLGGVIGQSRSAVGVYTEYISATSTDRLRIDSEDSFIGSVTNISVKELGEGWTIPLGWEVGASVINSVSGNTSLSQDVSAENNVSYKVSFNLSAFTSGTLYVDIGGSVAQTEITSGVKTLYFASLGTGLLRFYGGSFIGSITDISVKEIATSYLTQAGVLTADKTWMVVYSAVVTAGTVSATEWGDVISATATIIDYVQVGTTTDFRMVNIDGYFEGSVTSISAFLVDPLGYWTLGAGWKIGSGVAISDGTASSEMSQSLPAILENVAYRITFDINSFSSGTGYRVKLGSDTPYSISYNTVGTKSLCQRVTGGTTSIYFLSEGLAEGSITNVSVQKLDPNGYWIIGEGWCIGVDKAESDGTINNSSVNQQGALTSPVGKTYQVKYKIEDYISGSISASVGSVDYGTARDANGEFTESITVTSAPINILEFKGGGTSFDGSITDISVKQVGTYEDQSIYVTAADVQTIAQASVYYLVELTSMGSKNSLYFLPSSVVANNGRYTKLNFTVISKDALPQPTVGIISFYDSVGGFDTYPMGFYEFKIYEQTSSTNLDPLLATGLLEKGFAFVRDFSGNMQELTDDFNEYDPTLTQYVYSK